MRCHLSKPETSPQISAPPLQEFMILPVGATSFREAMTIGAEAGLVGVYFLFVFVGCFVGGLVFVFGAVLLVVSWVILAFFLLGYDTMMQ